MQLAHNGGRGAGGGRWNRWGLEKVGKCGPGRPRIAYPLANPLAGDWGTAWPITRAVPGPRRDSGIQELRPPTRLRITDHDR